MSVTIHPLYRDRSEGLAGKGQDTINYIVTGKGLNGEGLCRNTTNYILTGAGAGCWGVCHDINFVL